MAVAWESSAIFFSFAFAIKYEKDEEKQVIICGLSISMIVIQLPNNNLFFSLFLLLFFFP